MERLIAIGEALIDFIPSESGLGIEKVKSFEPKVGGAPANVCAAFTKLGGSSALITQLGEDPFGDKILHALSSVGIDCATVLRTKKANTSLAFVALKNDGNREFAFYRNPGADMLLEKDQLKDEWFSDSFALHFCSVSLGDFPMKDAHKKAIELARKNGAIVSFDPNLRPNLWNSADEMKNAVEEFLPLADVLKISDEEIEFLTGKTKIQDAIPQLFRGNVKLVVYTEGQKVQSFTRLTRRARATHSSVRFCTHFFRSEKRQKIWKI